MQITKLLICTTHILFLALASANMDETDVAVEKNRDKVKRVSPKQDNGQFLHGRRAS